MRAIFACAIAALLAAPQVVLAAKDGPDDAAAQPQGGWLHQASRALGDYNSRNAPGLYRACESVGLCKSVEKDDTEPPKPKRQCLGTEGANGECQLSAEAVCAAYAPSDEATATTPAIGLQSIVAVTGKSFRGVYFRVVELTSDKGPGRRIGQNKSKWKVKDSNGKDEFVFQAHLRDTSIEERKAFRDAETEAEAAKARGDKKPKRLGGAPKIMPGAIVKAEPSDAEIKIVKDPMHKAMCASGYNPQRKNYRDGNYKLLGMDLLQMVCFVDDAKCEIARREGKECERSYKQHDIRHLSRREQLSNPVSKTTRQTCRSRRRHVAGVTREPLGRESYSRRSRDWLVPTQRNLLRAADVVAWFR